LANCIDTGDQVDELIGFEQLSKHLIAGAVAANLDRDIGDDYDDPDELPPAVTVQAPSRPLTITIPPLNSTILSPQATQAKRTCIPLEILFNYTADMDMLSKGMNSF